MKKDHAHTYRGRSLKNWPHRQRLKEIHSVIRREELAGKSDLAYADFGCGTGFLTNIVADELNPAKVYGFDHSEHLEVAREKYPSFEFGFIELNERSDVGKFDFVTCFETLEHVGDLENRHEQPAERDERRRHPAPDGSHRDRTGRLLAKTILYRYRLDELAGGESSGFYFRYLLSLLLYRDMSTYRDERFGWGTHFGFDCRRIDEYLDSRNIRFRARNAVTTRFYQIKP